MIEISRIPLLSYDVQYSNPNDVESEATIFEKTS